MLDLFEKNNKIDLSSYVKLINSINCIIEEGRVVDVVGNLITSKGPAASVGDLCYIDGGNLTKPIPSEVVGFKGNYTLLMAIGTPEKISPKCRVMSTGSSISIGVGEKLLGRVLDGLGRVIDSKGPLLFEERRSVKQDPPHPLKRKRIKSPLSTGIRAIDGLLTCGKGQRMGVFSGSGVGKSILLGMIARETQADINVIALVGERGREVREFLERDLQEEGLKKSVVVVATSDKSAVVRIKASLVAMTIAEYFRDKGKDVLMMIDSITRIAMAQREVGLAIGEPPATKGYTPSVYSFLPKLLERAGTSDIGSITGLFAVLVEADDLNEPVADTVRSIIDGHIVLSRKLAHKNHFPAINILESVSRTMNDIIDEKHLSNARKLINLLAVYSEAEDLINIGAYAKGTNLKIDEAINKRKEIISYLRQNRNEKSTFTQARDSLDSIFKRKK